MNTIILHVPKELAGYSATAVCFIAAEFYEAGKLPLEQAAEMAGMNKWDFAEILINYDVDYFQYTSDDVIHDANKIV
jgi:predicted HTH domain antitoxin